MNFATLHLDTYKVVELLKERGYTKKQAEGFIKALQEVTLSGVATKEDIADLRLEMADIRKTMIESQSDLRTEISQQRDDMLKFVIIQTITLVGVMIALFTIF